MTKLDAIAPIIWAKWGSTMLEALREESLEAADGLAFRAMNSQQGVRALLIVCTTHRAQIQTIEAALQLNVVTHPADWESYSVAQMVFKTEKGSGLGHQERPASGAAPMGFCRSGGSCGKVFAGGGEAELAVFDAFRADDLVGKVLEGGRSAFEHDDFQAVVVVQVDVQGGNDGADVVVLKVSQLLLDVRTMVVVNQRHRAGGFVIRAALAVLDQAVAHHVGDGQGTVFVALHFAELSELTHEGFIGGNAEAGHAAFFAHCVITWKNVTPLFRDAAQ